MRMYEMCFRLTLSHKSSVSGVAPAASQWMMNSEAVATVSVCNDGTTLAFFAASSIQTARWHETEPIAAAHFLR